MDSYQRIYKYNDGFSDVYGDPTEIDYRMSASMEELDMQVISEWMDLPRDDDGLIVSEEKLTGVQKRNFLEACHRMLPVIRHAFQVKEFDKNTGQGLTMDELLALYADYLEWRSGIKKNTGSQQTDVMPTDSTSCSSEALKEPSIQKPVSRPQSVFMGSTSTPGVSNQSMEPNSLKPTSS